MAMITRYIHSIQTTGPYENMEPAHVKELKAGFPPAAARRMTRLALLIGKCLEGIQIRPDDSVIYATTFSETMCLESYLDSFPNPSPLMFQNSIHPSGLEQVLIARQQPVSEFLPFAGRRHVMHAALTAACSTDKARQWIIASEEQGTWLTEKGCGSPTDFAFHIGASDDPQGAIGRIIWDPSAPEAGPDDLLSLSTFTLFQQVSTRHSVASYCDSLGRIRIEWNP